MSAAAEYDSGPTAIRAPSRAPLDSVRVKNARCLGESRARRRLSKSAQGQGICQKKAKASAKKRPRQRAEAQEKAKREQEAEEGGPAYQTGMI